MLARAASLTYFTRQLGERHVSITAKPGSGKVLRARTLCLAPACAPTSPLRCRAVTVHAYGQGGQGWADGRERRPAEGGRGGRGGRGGGRYPRLDDEECPDLPTLARVVTQHIIGWAGSGRLGPLRAALSHAFKLGMRPHERPRDGDPARQELLRTVLDTLGAVYLPLLPTLRDPADCILLLWARAKAAYWEGELVPALLARLVQDGGELMQRAEGRTHALLWWSLSEAPQELLASPHAQEALRLSGQLLLRFSATGPKSRSLNSQDCSNVLLAAIRLRPGSALLHHVTACLVELGPWADCQALANSVYALGKLAEQRTHTPRQQDLQRLAAEVAARLEGQAADPNGAGPAFVPQALSNMLYACAKLDYTDSDLLRPLVDVTLGSLRLYPSSFTPQALSNTLWALAALQPPGWEALAEAAAKECQRRGFHGFAPQALSNAAWALSKLGQGCFPEWYHGWYSAAAKAAIQLGFMAAATAQQQSNLLYALGLVRHRPPAALLVGMAASQQLRTQTNSHDCANSLWALARLYGSLDQEGTPADSRSAAFTLVGVLAVRLDELLRGAVEDQRTDQALANSLWALTVMGTAVLSLHSGPVEGLLREVVQRWEAQGSFAIEHIDQLSKVQARLEQEQPGCVGRLNGVMAGCAGLAEALKHAASTVTSVN